MPRYVLSQSEVFRTKQLTVRQRSYKEYKDILPTYKLAEKYRFAAEDAERQIKTLREDLASARASQSNGASSGGDGAYWKNKYDGLLANIGN